MCSEMNTVPLVKFLPKGLSLIMSKYLTHTTLGTVQKMNFNHFKPSSWESKKTEGVWYWRILKAMKMGIKSDSVMRTLIGNLVELDLPVLTVLYQY
jgi:hypothetical protein